jgi:putative ABC transport system ATP-binding protein
MTPLLWGRGVGRVYGRGALAARALHPSDLALRAGEVVVLAGPSGSGKTTLLSILGLVLAPSEGEVWLDGAPVRGGDVDGLARLRLRAIGFVFQQLNLIAGLSAAENVELPLLLDGQPAGARRRRARAALEAVGLGAQAARKPRQLSVGQQQRVAIARALVGEPRAILCDEPTAALDAEAGRVVLDLLRGLAAGAGRAVLIVTHDERVLRVADRVVHVADGRVLGGGA